MSNRLYYDDPALLAFDATVRACEPAADRYRLALDRTAFYPTSGGQPHDLGHLQAADRVVSISNVTSDDEEEVWHHVSEAIAPGTHVSGTIDRVRRQDFRQQHSGQHILSAAFDHVLSARTESVHLGVEDCTLDLHREVTADECRRAEDAANGVVWDNRPVSIRYADASDLAHEPRLRKITAREGRVRLIDIAGHDLSACGGTHVSTTGEVGLIAIRGTERFRGGTRVTFLAGRRALESYRALRDTADAAARTLSVAAADVPDALMRLREDLKQEQRRAMEAIERVTVLQAESLASGVDASGLLVAELPAADALALRVSASQLVAVAGRVVALISGSSPHALVIARSADRADVDAGALVRQICAAHGGKGGGRPDLAQAGGVDVTVEALRAVLKT
ncbi:Alanine--tRNA ligase [Luteitalea pratensis]|uniref:Alanine--tRNA ligase n=1 Tax=Luteitalea pratensis TaxID=1855912 RepID=A0A143PG21_LUTPR|nr:DHHA1 domain-containing protein [Luteitalea pratensis]AMY07471.1 Alanine--tRNA ligase [Luteitalea pratensis]